MSENRSNESRKLATKIVCGGILLAGLAAGSHWHRGSTPRAASSFETSARSNVRAAQPSVVSHGPKRPVLAISHPAKPNPAPESSVSELRSAATSSPAISPIARAQAVTTYAALPMMFEANSGQTDPRVKFLSRAPGYTLFLTDQEAVLSLPVVSAAPAPAQARQHSRGSPDALPDKSEAPRLSRTVHLKFAGSNTPTAITGRDQLPGKSNYFIGNDPKQWHTNVSNYSAVEYRGIYSGVDAVFHGDNRRLEFDFDVAPGADPKSIALEVEGARRIRLNRAGDVVLAMDATRDMVMGKPLIYQQSPAGRREIAGRYVLAARNRIAFALGPYDHTQPLVIDPTLAYATYLGGSSGALPFAIAADSSGSAYITGWTGSSNFPVTSGAYETSCTLTGKTTCPDIVAFVTKLSPDGSSQVYSTFLNGHTGADQGNAIAVDSSGDAYIAGSEQGELDFPTTTGVIQPTCNVAANLKAEVFVAKLNPSGSELVYSTCLQNPTPNATSGFQPGSSYPSGISLDSDGNAYVTGQTTDPQDFPTTQGSLQTTCQVNGSNGCTVDYDPFVVKINASGTSLLYSTFLSGGAYSSNVTTTGIAVDSLGNAYVIGDDNDFAPFPKNSPGGLITTSGSLVSSCPNYTCSGFLAKINGNATALVYSTYLGNVSNYASPIAVAVDQNGYAYVTGYTSSTDFPTTVGALQYYFNPPGSTTTNAGDGFVVKMDPLGDAYAYATFLAGTSMYTWPAGIALDASDNAYITGGAYPGFPTTPGAFQTSIPAGAAAAGSQAFLSELNPQGASLLYSTFLTGTNGQAEYNTGGVESYLALDPSGNAYVLGYTTSTSFPTTSGAFQQNQAAASGSGSAFIVKFSFPQPITLAISPTTISSGSAGLPYPATTFTATGGQGTVTISESGSLPVRMTFSGGVLSGTPTQTGSYPITISATDSQNDTGSENLTLVINCPTITIAPSTLPNGMVGTIYPAVTFSETGGVGSVTFSETGLPTGIGMSFAAGVLSGTPTASESFPITITATDSNSCTGSTSDTLTINSVTLPPAVVIDNETITVTDAETFPDVADSENIQVTDGVTVTPLLSITAPVASFSTSSLGFGTVAAGTTGTQTITVSNVGEGQTGLVLSDAAISPSGTPFSIGAISCSNSASSLSTTLPSGGACLVTISYVAPSSGTPPSATISFTDNAALSNLTSTLSGSSYMQTISLNGTGTTAPQPTEPPATVSVSDNETVTVTDTSTFPDVADSETITVNDQVSIMVSQTITFGPAPTVVVGGSGALTATASSGLPVTFSSTTPAICSVTGSSVAGLAIGSCIVAANQAGNAKYSPAPQVTQTISINPSTGLSPATLTFADELVGSTSATQTVTLTNAGTGAVTVGPIATTADFTHPSKTCTATLAAGSSCTISVAFAPRTAGVLTGTLTVGTNGTVALSGTGIVPSASITPATYTFGNQQVGTTSAVQTFTYSNTGLVPITVSSLALTGAAAANYAIASDGCSGETLPPAATCNVGVIFTPSAANNRAATLSAADESGGAAKATASLNGLGVAPTASLSGNAAFGNQQVGVTSAVQLFTYQNTGIGPIRVSSVTLSGTAAANYVIATDACTGVTLAASATCSIGLTFTPSAEGSRTASLKVTDSTGGALARSMSLSGTGVAPTISLGSGTYAYGAVTAATAATFTLTNSGTAPFAISTIALSTGTQFNLTGGTCLAGGSVSDGSSCTVIVTFTPSGKTTFTDTLTVQGTGVGTGAPTYTASRVMTGH